jgi:hypothetical protein
VIMAAAVALMYLLVGKTGARGGIQSGGTA